jgi:hypothetical protein
MEVYSFSGWISLRGRYLWEMGMEHPSIYDSLSAFFPVIIRKGLPATALRKINVSKPEFLPGSEGFLLLPSIYTALSK